MEIGDKYQTPSGICEVVNYFGARRVEVKFKTGFRTFATTQSLQLGTVKDLCHPIIYGRGFIGDGEFVPKNNKAAHNAWKHMQDRCYSGKHPSYDGCLVAKRWFNFQNFCIDTYSMPNAYENDFELDKDWLVLGNTQYSKSKCCFLPREINAFHVKQDFKIQQSSNKFRMQIRLGGISKSQYFDTEKEARQEYMRLKNERGKYLAKKYKSVIPNTVYLHLMKVLT